MMTNLAISAQGLGKRYRIRGGMAREDSLRDALKTGVASLLSGREPSPNRERDFWALRDASFDIRFGENVGIIGLNGAGKSTLLKLLSRIVTPTEGTARINGRLGALLEVGTGFHHELTGRENVYLYGAILGMSRAEVARKFDAIVDFSEVGGFIDTPIKRYSSGMYVRLAFAVAAHLEPDILLLDEVLAVGDYTFQRKCLDFAHQLQRKGATILFVSHNMFSIKSMCERVIYLKDGRIQFDGSTDEGLKLYEANSRLAVANWFGAEAGTSPITITDVQICGEDGEPKTLFDFGERLRVRVSYRAVCPIEEPHFIVSITRSDDLLCCNFSSHADNLKLPPVHGSGTIELLTPPLKLVSDRYTVTIVARERGFKKMLTAQIGGMFHMRHDLFDPSAFGVFHEPGHWQVGTAGGE